jgi:Fe-S-cluster containining protein
MAKALPVFYDCHNCPSYCCSYPRIAVTEFDIRRLARHFAIDERSAKKRFTKKGEDRGEIILRHQKDRIFGTVCRFLDRETRMCTVHQARPGVCRSHPGSSQCGYYNFLMSERRYQEDPEFIATAYNVPGS